jgi:hypothetical protein
MNQPSLSCYGLKSLPRIGKDHLALADWRLSVPHQRNRRGESLGYVEFDFHHASGTKRISLEGGSRIGLPTGADDLFLIGLLTLASASGFPTTFHFEPSHLLQVLRLPVHEKYIKAQRQAFERFVALTAMFRGTWFDRQSKHLDGDFITGVIAEVCYRPRPGRRAKGEQPATYVQFTDNFHRSLTAGNLINIDLELLAGWRSPTAALLYRHLNKVWHSGRKPRRYERDLKEIACGHLHMTDGKNLKENFAAVLREMEQREYLTPMSAEERFHAVRRGVWRVSFELHPSRITKTNAALNKVPLSNEAQRVINEYARARFGSEEYAPHPHEVEHAKRLISDFGLDAVSHVIPRVAERVKQQSKNDVYFGFAVPHFRTELESQVASHRSLQKRITTTTTNQVDQSRLQQQAQQRQKHHARLLTAWRDATPAQRAALRLSALQHAASETARRRIVQSDVEQPTYEILRELALVTGGGESSLLYS